MPMVFKYFLDGATAACVVAFGWMFALVFHEYGHAAAIWCLLGEIPAVELSPIMGVTDYSAFSGSPVIPGIISAAGYGLPILLGIISILVLRSRLLRQVGWAIFAWALISIAVDLFMCFSGSIASPDLAKLRYSIALSPTTVGNPVLWVIAGLVMGSFALWAVYRAAKTSETNEVKSAMACLLLAYGLNICLLSIAHKLQISYSGLTIMPLGVYTFNAVVVLLSILVATLIWVRTKKKGIVFALTALLALGLANGGDFRVIAGSDVVEERTGADESEIILAEAVSLSNSGKHSESAALWEQLALKYRMQAQFQIHLGIELYRARDYRKAEAALLEAQLNKVDPTRPKLEPVIHHYLGRIYSETDRKSSACTEFQNQIQATSVMPGYLAEDPIPVMTELGCEGTELIP